MNLKPGIRRGRKGQPMADVRALVVKYNPLRMDLIHWRMMDRADLKELVETHEIILDGVMRELGFVNR